MTTRRGVILVQPDAHLMRAANELPVELTVLSSRPLTDIEAAAVGPHCHITRVRDILSMDSLLAGAMEAVTRKSQLTGIVTSEEEALVATCMLGTYMGITTLPPNVALNFRDKSLQKTLIRNAAIPTALSHSIDLSAVSARDIAEAFPKSVLKPSLSGGTQQTYLIRNVEDAENALKEIDSANWAHLPFVLEEFIDGDEWVINGYMHAGRLEFMSIGVYATSCLNVVASSSALQVTTLNPRDHPDEYSILRPLVESSLTTLGLQGGVFHMELFATKSNYSFGECAARRGGGMTQEVVNSQFHVSLADVALRLAARVPLRPLPEPDNNIHGSSALVAPPGLILRLPNEQEILEKTGVDTVLLEKGPGYRIPTKATGTFSRIGQVAANGSTKQDLERKLSAARRYVESASIIKPELPLPRDRREWQESLFPNSATHFKPYTR